MTVTFWNKPRPKQYSIRITKRNFISKRLNKIYTRVGGNMVTVRKEIDDILSLHVILGCKIQ